MQFKAAIVRVISGRAAPEKLRSAALRGRLR
jgi:hypothetical protein